MYWEDFSLTKIRLMPNTHSSLATYLANLSLTEQNPVDGQCRLSSSLSGLPRQKDGVCELLQTAADVSIPLGEV